MFKMILYIIFILTGSFINCEIINTSKDKTVVEGTTMTFTCTSNVQSKDLHFYWIPVFSVFRKIIYNGNVLDKDKYYSYVSVQNNQKTVYLSITNITMNDAGKILCTDDNRIYMEMQLSVVSIELPNCTNTCINDEMYLKCTFKYASENVLIPQWNIGKMVVDEIYGTEIYTENILKRTSYGHYAISCQMIKNSLSSINKTDKLLLTMTIHDMTTKIFTQSYNLNIETPQTCPPQTTTRNQTCPPQTCPPQTTSRNQTCPHIYICI